jgi:hypothetical protein
VQNASSQQQLMLAASGCPIQRVLDEIVATLTRTQIMKKEAARPSQTEHMVMPAL